MKMDGRRSRSEGSLIALFRTLLSQGGRTRAPSLYCVDSIFGDTLDGNKRVNPVLESEPWQIYTVVNAFQTPVVRYRA